MVQYKHPYSNIFWACIACVRSGRFYTFFLPDIKRFPHLARMFVGAGFPLKPVDAATLMWITFGG
jgi:hypothetical protein